MNYLFFQNNIYQRDCKLCCWPDISLHPSSPHVEHGWHP